MTPHFYMWSPGAYVERGTGREWQAEEKSVQLFAAGKMNTSNHPTAGFAMFLVVMSRYALASYPATDIMINPESLVFPQHLTSDILEAWMGNKSLTPSNPSITTSWSGPCVANPWESTEGWGFVLVNREMFILFRPKSFLDTSLQSSNSTNHWSLRQTSRRKKCRMI